MNGPIDVAFDEAGLRTGQTLVLAHAIGASRAMWNPQLARLAEHYRVISYDHRGHGASPVPPGPYAIEDLGLDLIHLLDRLRVNRASICGLSLGGMVGLWVAAHAPERVERLIACCVIARPASPAAWRDRATTVRKRGVAGVADLVVDRWGYADRAPDVASRVRAMLAATPDEGYAACCEAIADLDLEPDLSRIAAPTLVLSGADDPAAAPDEARRLAARVAGAKVVIIKRAGHLANVEQPRAVSEAIISHLEASDGEPSR
jgi:3-oxoadipate enol-lactonase